MTIKTKHNAQAMVWVVVANKAMAVQIDGIKITVDRQGKPYISYQFRWGPNQVEATEIEDRVFSTKQKLLASL